MDELIRVVGPTEFYQYVLYALGGVYLLLLVHCLDSWKSRPKWLDDLVVASVHLFMICIPCTIVKKIDITINTKSWLQLSYWGLVALSLYFNKTRLCKYTGIQPQISMNTICTMKDLIPDKKNTELWDRLSELMPLILLIAVFVASHNFLYDYISNLLGFSLLINAFFLFCDCHHFHQKAKKTA
jgi:hypothetical protein